MNFKALFAIIAPGLLVAATGVGAGDLITAGFAGNYLGLEVLWAPVLGGILKFSLNEGLTRWQLSTDSTLLEGWLKELGKWIEYIFLVYLVIWTFMVCAALINACGVAGSSFFDLGEHSKLIWGVLHSLIGVVLVKRGSFDLFEKLMAGFILIMFFVVVSTAVMLKPDFMQVISGTFIPKFDLKNMGWILGVLGGVGGTLTMLSYGYWIRESGRSGKEGLAISRLDLAVSYTVTALFSMAMIIIGSKLDLTGVSKGNFSVTIALKLKEVLGGFGYYAFLLGFWGGVFSSLLGVWQSVPYLFTDYMKLKGKVSETDYKQSKYYSNYLYAMAIIPIVSLFLNFEKIQLAYAVMGAFFMPLLALSLLLLNNRIKEMKNGWLANLILTITLCFFSYTGIQKIISIIQAL